MFFPKLVENVAFDINVYFGHSIESSFRTVRVPESEIKSLSLSFQNFLTMTQTFPKFPTP